MNSKPRTLICALAISTSLLSAQQPVVHEQTTSLSTMPASLPLHDLNPATSAPGNYEYIAMFPREDHVGWGFDASDPNSHHIAGARVFLGDTNAATSHPFNIWVMTENASAAGQPAVQTATLFQINSPIGQAGPGAFLLDVVFPSPVLLPNNADVFISVELLPESVPDHISILALSPDDISAVGGTIWDVANNRTTETGHGVGTSGGYGYFIDWQAGQMFFELAQYGIAPLARQARFATGVVTSQASLPSSNPGANPGYSTGLFSARQPAVWQDRLGGARTDDPVLLYQNGNLLQSEVAAFLMGQLAPTPIDLGLVLPGSTGTLCLTRPVPISAGPLVLSATGSASLTLSIPASSRASTVGLTLGFTAIALDVTAGSVHAGSCGVIRF